jgi:hypothetical protein
VSNIVRPSQPRETLLVLAGVVAAVIAMLVFADAALAGVVSSHPTGGGPNSSQIGANAQRQAAAIGAAVLAIVGMYLAISRFGAQDHKGLALVVVGFIAAGLFIFRPEKIVAFGDKLINAVF